MDGGMCRLAVDVTDENDARDVAYTFVQREYVSN